MLIVLLSVIAEVESNSDAARASSLTGTASVKVVFIAVVGKIVVADNPIVTSGDDAGNVIT